MAELNHEAQPEGEDTTTSHQTTTNTQEEANLHRERKRSNIVTKLKRMLPGSTNHIGAIGQEDGSITNEPEAMAAALAKHWSKVFQKKQSTPPFSPIGSAHFVVPASTRPTTTKTPTRQNTTSFLATNRFLAKRCPRTRLLGHQPART